MSSFEFITADLDVGKVFRAMARKNAYDCLAVRASVHMENYFYSHFPIYSSAKLCQCFNKIDVDADSCAKTKTCSTT